MAGFTASLLSATDPTGAFDSVLNAGKTCIRGAELMATYSTSFGLSLGGGITYTDAKLTRDLDADVMAASCELILLGGGEPDDGR